MKTQTKAASSLAALAKIDAAEFSFSLIAGSGLAGYVRTSYDQLLLTFGAPTHRGSSDGKISVEWVIRVGSTVATIYDYKGDCLMNDTIADWHIGGKKAAIAVVAALTGFETREAY